ncbi:MAG: copper resistance protein CopC [Propionicimonas sp.]|nr:copper resistance protein CopC [Propionicimonas sp.]
MKSGRLLAALAAALLCFSVPATPALAADDNLVVSDPEAHSELTREPGWVMLVFKTEASATLAAIVVQNSAGENVATGPLIVEGTNVTTQLISGLAKDTYTVIYRTEDADGQPRGGAFQFSYGPGTWTDVDDVWVGEEEQPPQIDDPGPAATPVATAEPTPTPTGTEPATPTQTATAAPTTQTSPSASPAPAPQNGGGVTPWLVALGVLLVIGSVVWALVSRRNAARRTPPDAG